MVVVCISVGRYVFGIMEVCELGIGLWFTMNFRNRILGIGEYFEGKW